MSRLEQPYPLEWPEGWPKTPDNKKEQWSRFQTTYHKALADLMDELRLLPAVNVVVSSWLPLRRDGVPYANVARRRIEDPGVAVYFTYKSRRMVIARDKYWNVHDNLRSIGHAIKHMRGLERHGGGHMMERAFQGFEALPAPDSSSNSWWDVLGCPPDCHILVAKEAYKKAVMKAHPDHGGTPDQFQKVQDAWAKAQEQINEQT